MRAPFTNSINRKLHLITHKQATWKRSSISTTGRLPSPWNLRRMNLIFSITSEARFWIPAKFLGSKNTVEIGWFVAQNYEKPKKNYGNWEKKSQVADIFMQSDCPHKSQSGSFSLIGTSFNSLGTSARWEKKKINWYQSLSPLKNVHCFSLLKYSRVLFHALQTAHWKLISFVGQSI